MSATAVQSTIPVSPPLISSEKNKPKPITWATFQRKYLVREDGFKYEWLAGKMEKTTRSMDKTQLYLLYNLSILFRKFLNLGKVHGELVAEPDLFFLENHRRPDIAWLTIDQIYRLAEPEAYEVPEFVIEVISKNDQLNVVKGKMVNYRDAGVKVVWQIFPNYQQVDVYSGPNLELMTVCSDDKICSAAPALPNFEIPASAIFMKPVK